MPAFLAYLHHLAAFTLVAAVAIEFMLLRGELSHANARRILATDAVLGAAAGVVLLAGLLRVFYFEKGAAFYFQNVAFLAKLALFVAVALASIYPTVKFLSWRKALKAGRAPAVEPATLRRIRRLVHWELAGIAILILCAALMARGIGSF